jgi:hypothetical protein
MAFVKVRVPRTSQPQELVGVDPYWIGRKACHLSIGGEDLANSIPLTLNSQKVVSSQKGIALAPPSNTAIGATTPARLITSNGAGTGDFTLLFYGNPVASTTRSIAACTADAVGGSVYEPYLQVNCTNNLTAQSGTFSGSLSAASSAGNLTGAVDGTFKLFALTRTNGVLSIYAGTSYATGVTDTTSIYRSGFKYSVGAYVNSSAYGSSEYGIVLAGAFNSALTQNELLALNANPWQIFEPEECLIWIPDAVSAGGGATNGSITSTDATDTQSGTAANWTTAQVSTTDAADISAATTSAGSLTSASIATTDASDATALNAANWMTAQSAQADGADATSVSAQAGSVTLASIGSVDGADTASSTAANWIVGQAATVDTGDTSSVVTAVTTGAALATTDAPDTTALTGNIVGVTSCTVSMTDAADLNAMQTLVTTGAVMYGTDGSDSALIAAGNWAMAVVAAIDSADVMTMRGGDQVAFTLIPNPRMIVRGSALTRIVKGNKLVRTVR